MTVHIPPYLQSYLDVADALPIRLADASLDDIEMLQQRLRDLVALVANRDGQIVKLTRELDRLHPAIQKVTR